jgi:hypothetical protein
MPPMAGSESEAVEGIVVCGGRPCLATLLKCAIAPAWHMAYNLRPVDSACKLDQGETPTDNSFVSVFRPAPPAPQIQDQH